MIYASDIIDRLNAALDAEGSDRYLFATDFKPAINYSVEWLVSLFNSVFAKNKLSEESLRELVRVGVWQTSTNSRVSFDPVDTGNDLWSILGVLIDLTYDIDGVIPTPSSTSQSVYVPNASYLSADFIADRLTLEERTTNKNNPFAAGNTMVFCPGIKQYGYINFSDYTGGYNSLDRIVVKATTFAAGNKSFILAGNTETQTITSVAVTSYETIATDLFAKVNAVGTEWVVVNNLDGTITITGADTTQRISVDPTENIAKLILKENKAEIEIVPEVDQDLIAISYLKAPAKLTGTDADLQAIEFPEVLTDMIVNKALEFIAYKQGDATNLYGVTKGDMNQLITLMS